MRERILFRSRYGLFFVILREPEKEPGTGSKPMNVVWRLADEIPAKYINQTRKMLVG